MDSKLVAYYRGSVGRRIAALKTAQGLLQNTAQAAAARAEIQRIAHALKGTGSSYGFPEISDAARDVEVAPPEVDLSPALGRLLEVLEAVAEPGGEL